MRIWVFSAIFKKIRDVGSKKAHFWTKFRKGQNSLFSKNFQNGLKSSKMVPYIKIAQFNPNFNGICPVL